MPPMVTIVLFIIREDLGSIIISNKEGFQKMNNDCMHGSMWCKYRN